MMMTTASAAYRSVPSMPLNALPESAAVPSGPAICTVRPSAPATAMARSESAAGPAALQPLLPRLTGTIVSIALPSLETIGPVTWPWMAPGTWANFTASAAAFALSAGVTPDARSYTTTAGYTLGETASDRRLRTCVDSALGGSQDDASFFSAPVSFPDSGPATATRMSQNTSTSHFVRRPAGIFSSARIVVIPVPSSP